MSLISSRYFVYNKKSSQDYNVVIGFFDQPNYQEMIRTVQRDDLKILSKETHVYGAIDNETIKFTFSIVKCDGSEFSQAESIMINEWLLSPIVPQKFQFVTDEENVYDELNIYYYALCTSIKDTVVRGVCGKTLTFETNSPYGYIHSPAKKYIIENERTFNFYNNDNLFDKSYPVLTLESDELVTIENITTNETYSYDLSEVHKIRLDNEKMKVTSDNKLISLSKLGWDDLDIRWFYFVKGTNKLKITGNVVIEIQYIIRRRTGGI